MDLLILKYIPYSFFGPTIAIFIYIYIYIYIYIIYIYNLLACLSVVFHVVDHNAFPFSF